jgi:hypothetical protein
VEKGVIDMFAIALTDPDWFQSLRDLPPKREVNFWTPTPWNLRRLRRGERFYFMLEAPYRLIGGVGHFARYENMRASAAWRRYGTRNGVSSLAALVERAEKYAKKRSPTHTSDPDPLIGCVVLTQPEFYDDTEFLRPEDFGVVVLPEVAKVKYVDGEGFGIHPPEIQDVIAVLEDRSSGGGRRQRHAMSAEARKAVADHATKGAMQYFQRQGWPSVEDVHATHPFDLLCTNVVGDELRVEVKGTVSDGSEVLLTRDGVRHAQRSYPHTALYILANVEVTKRGGRVMVRGGRQRVYNPWNIDHGTLMPVGYSYRLP